MPQEIELKLRIADAAEVRCRLAECGAAFRERVLEHNSIFDDAERRLLAAGCGLRVRMVEPVAGDAAAGRRGGTLTFKGPRQPGSLKVREEIEVACSDSAALIEILGRLGLRVVVLYEKRRETWTLHGCEVALDELPRLGWFVEIEGPDEATISAARSALQLDPAPVVPESYVSLAAEHGDAVEGRRELRL